MPHNKGILLRMEAHPRGRQFTLQSVESLLLSAFVTCLLPQWGTADAEIKVLSELPVLNAICLKPEVGQNIATRASPSLLPGFLPLSNF